MFTGIIEHIGIVDSLKVHGDGGRLTIHAPTVAPQLAIATPSFDAAARKPPTP